MTRQPIAHLKDTDKYKLVQKCIDKENWGWECIVPIRRSSTHYKHFSPTGYRYEYQGIDHRSFYEAVYRLNEDRREVNTCE